MKIYSNTTYEFYRAMNLSMFLHLSRYQFDDRSIVWSHANKLREGILPPSALEPDI